MTHRTRATLTVWKKMLLATTAAAAIIGPVAVGALSASLRAQSTAADATNAPAFDVTSVKPNNSGSGRILMQQVPGGGWNGTNVTLGMLIRMANQLQDNQIVGGPKWLFADRYDVLGKGSAPGREGPFFPKLKTLLADRFGLVVHTEKRELPMYALVLARRDGKLGPKLAPSTADCAPPAPAPGGRGEQPPPRPFVMPGPGERPRCGFMIGPGSIMAGGSPLSSLATNLSRLVGSMVVDKTGLAGNFDWTLEFAPDPNMAGRGDLPQPPPGVGPERPASDGPSIFSALQEQLGLKLDSTKGPVDVLVIDRAEKPTPD
jgi:bla regulator protein BlaR1